MPVGEPSCDAAVRTDQRGKAGKVLIGGGARLACQPDPQPQALRLAARIAQTATLPPGKSPPPGCLVNAPPVQSWSGREQDQARTGRRGGIERRVEPSLSADDNPEPGAGVLEDNRSGRRGIALFALAEMPLALNAGHLPGSREYLGDGRLAARGAFSDPEAHPDAGLGGRPC